jgi:hypothetical protein
MILNSSKQQKYQQQFFFYTVVFLLLALNLTVPFYFCAFYSLSSSPFSLSYYSMTSLGPGLIADLFKLVLILKLAPSRDFYVHI